LGALAVPVSALAGTNPATNPLVPGATYVVRSGDTLWSIAQRLDPTGNPGRLVSQMASETGSVTVVAGEHIVLP
jgi:Tfp pilus assembly protein FimV